MPPHKIEGILFDLDDTLFDCTGQLTGSARIRAAKILCENVPTLNLDELVHAQANLSMTLGSGGAIQEIGVQYQLPPALIQEARTAYNLDIVEEIFPFPDTHQTLQELVKRGYKMAVVTSGLPQRQRRKIQLLGLHQLFDESNNTLIIHNDHKTKDKTPFMAKGAEALNLPAHKIIAVGDKLDAEISAGNDLGMQTVRMLHGRQKDRKPQNQKERSDHEINTLSELLQLLP